MTLAGAVDPGHDQAARKISRRTNVQRAIYMSGSSGNCQSGRAEQQQGNNHEHDANRLETEGAVRLILASGD